MSGAVESQVLEALSAAFATDPDVRALLGHPIRLAQREGESLAFPFARIGDVQTRSQDSAGAIGFDLTFSVHVWVREGGRGLAQAIVAALRNAAHGRSLGAQDFYITLLLVTAVEIARESDALTTHSVLRVRAVCEPK